MLRASIAAAGAATISVVIAQLLLSEVRGWPILIGCAGVAFIFSWLGVAGRRMLVLGTVMILAGLLAGLTTPLLFIPLVFIAFGVGAVASSAVEMVMPVVDG